MPARPTSGASVLQPEVTHAIINAVLDEWTDRGYARMSMEAVARRAGVGKSALYRRWSSKQRMAMAVLGELEDTMLNLPDTGSLRGDLAAGMHALLGWLTYPRIGPIIADLVAETTRDPELGSAVHTVLRMPRHEQTRELFDRAVARGEINPDTDPELVTDLVASIVYWRTIVRGKAITDDYLDAVINILQHGLTPHPKQT